MRNSYTKPGLEKTLVPRLKSKSKVTFSSIKRPIRGVGIRTFAEVFLGSGGVVNGGRGRVELLVDLGTGDGGWNKLSSRHYYFPLDMTTAWYGAGMQCFMLCLGFCLCVLTGICLVTMYLGMWTGYVSESVLNETLLCHCDQHGRSLWYQSNVCHNFTLNQREPLSAIRWNVWTMYVLCWVLWARNVIPGWGLKHCDHHEWNTPISILLILIQIMDPDHKVQE